MTESPTAEQTLQALRKAAVTIYIAVEQPAAIELSHLFSQAAEHLDFHMRLVEELRSRIDTTAQRLDNLQKKIF